MQRQGFLGQLIGLLFLPRRWLSSASSALDIFRDEFVPNAQNFGTFSYRTWKRAYPAENKLWVAYRNAVIAGGKPSPPSMATAFGKMLVAPGRILPVGIFKDKFVPNIQTFRKTSYSGWKASNPSDAKRWETYRDAIIAGGHPAPPVMVTKIGMAFVSAGQFGQPVASLDYFVSLSGNDSTGDGSSAAPWRTVQHACAVVPTGTPATIRVGAGTFVESSTCNLPDGISLVGAGQSNTIIRASGTGVTTLINVNGTSSPQTISDLQLDGQAQTTSRYGIWAQSVSNLKILRVQGQGFKGPESTVLYGLAGGALNLQGATDCEVGNCVFNDSGGIGSGSGHDWCTGTIAIGGLLRCTLHDITVSAATAYAVKAAGFNATFTDVQMWNCDFQALSSTCQTWNTLCFELWSTGEVVNFEIRNCNFNKPMSLTTDTLPLSSGTRYHVHHNRWTVPGGNNYAMEIIVDNMEIDHNYISGGNYPFYTSEPVVREKINMHHNVIDNTAGPTAACHLQYGVSNCAFTKNTVVMRQSSWTNGVFQLGPGGTINIADNVFDSTLAIGDKLGLGLGSATIDHNSFWNMTSRGTNAITADPQLPLSGGFPSAYIPPSGSPVLGIGAWSDGAFVVGPQ